MSPLLPRTVLDEAELEAEQSTRQNELSRIGIGSFPLGNAHHWDMHTFNSRTLHRY